LHAINEVVREVPPSRVLDRESVPVLAEPLGGGFRFEADDHLDFASGICNWRRAAISRAWSSWDAA
jgi:hypothetical protein